MASVNASVTIIPVLKSTATNKNIAGNKFKTFAWPGRSEIFPDRHRLANTFPPVSAGLSNLSPVGFHPIFELVKTADTVRVVIISEDKAFCAAHPNPA
jgi:hypothetical protein